MRPPHSRGGGDAGGSEAAAVRDSALSSMNLYLCFMKLIKVSYLLHLAIFVHNV